MTLKNLSHIPLFVRGSGIVPIVIDPDPCFGQVQSSRFRTRGLKFVVAALESSTFTLFDDDNVVSESQRGAHIFRTSVSSGHVDLSGHTIDGVEYYIFEFFVEYPPIKDVDDHDGTLNDGTAPGKGAKSVYVAVGESGDIRREVPMFLDRGELFCKSKKMCGWYFDVSRRRVCVKLSHEMLSANDDPDGNRFSITVSYDEFDLIGM